MRRSPKGLSAVAAIGLIAAVSCAVALSACGAKSAPHRDAAPAARQGRLAIYSSLPLATRAGRAIANGIGLAVASANAAGGTVRITYHSLRDDPVHHRWKAGITVANVSQAATDPYAGLYVGAMTPDANAVTSPILAQASIAQLSPAGPVPQIASSNVVSIGASLGVQPNLVAQALQQAGCGTVLITAPSTVGSVSATRNALAQALRSRNIRIAANKAVRGFMQSLTSGVMPDIGALYTFGSLGGPRSVIDVFGTNLPLLSAAHSRCTVVSGLNTANVGSLASYLHRSGLHSRIFGVVAGCVGRGAALLPSLSCVAPGLPLASYAGTSAFSHRYRSRFGRAADADALYGYAAANLFANTVAGIGTHALQRSALLSALTATAGELPVLQRYTFGRNGRMTIGFRGLRAQMSGGAGGHKPALGVVPLSVL